MDDKKWIAENKYKFYFATERDIPELVTFFRDHFFKDEPIMRNLKILEGKGMIDRYLRNELCKYLVTNPILNNETSPASIVVRSTIDNSILGCRLGEIVERNHEKDKSILPVSIARNPPLYIPLPKKFIDVINIVKQFSDLKYGKTNAFDDLKDAEKIYFATNVCVSSKGRGLGLGSELVRRGYIIAKENGCDYTYTLASSVYSQNIFHKLGSCIVLNQARYKDFKFDRRGRHFLVDPQEHKVIQVLAVRHLNELMSQYDNN